MMRKHRAKDPQRTKEIARESSRQFREAHPRYHRDYKRAERADPAAQVKYRASLRRSYAKHKVRRRKEAKRKRDQDVEAFRALQREYYARTATARRAARRQYYVSHLAFRRFWRKQYKAQRTSYEAGAAGKFTEIDINNLLQDQRNKCPMCFATLVGYEIDHIIPLSRGGTN